MVGGLRASCFSWHFGAGGDPTCQAGVLAAFIVMHYQGVNANIMSLACAIAIGAMVDAAW